MENYVYVNFYDRGDDRLWIMMNVDKDYSTIIEHLGLKADGDEYYSTLEELKKRGAELIAKTPFQTNINGEKHTYNIYIFKVEDWYVYIQ